MAAPGSPETEGGEPSDTFERSDLILTFEVVGRRFAIPLRHVREIVRAVAVTPLPGAPPIVEGIIDIRGELVPVFDLRRRIGLPRKPVATSDHFIVTQAGGRLATLWVDRALTLLELPAEGADPAPEVPSRAEYVAAVVKLADGLVIIQDLLRFLSPSEEATLDGSLHDFASPKAPK